MFRWHLITYNFHALQLVTTRIKLLGVEVYSPTKIQIKKRRDCNAVRRVETPLFPGYLFVRIDPEVVHYSVIADISGVKEFVRFGGDISTVSNGLIEALKHSMLLQVDKKIASLECRNVSADVLRDLSAIKLMKNLVERQTALFALLKSDSLIGEAAQRSYAQVRISSAEKHHVDERLW
jgi:transcriptional antiterminator RfaH